MASQTRDHKLTEKANRQVEKKACFKTPREVAEIVAVQALKLHRRRSRAVRGILGRERKSGPETPAPRRCRPAFFLATCSISSLARMTQTVKALCECFRKLHPTKHRRGPTSNWTTPQWERDVAVNMASAGWARTCFCRDCLADSGGSCQALRRIAAHLAWSRHPALAFRSRWPISIATRSTPPSKSATIPRSPDRPVIIGGREKTRGWSRAACYIAPHLWRALGDCRCSRRLAPLPVRATVIGPDYGEICPGRPRGAPSHGRR